MQVKHSFLFIIAFSMISLLNGHPAKALCTLPYVLTNGQTTDATQVMSNFSAVVTCLQNSPAGSVNALQFNAGNGSLGGVGPLTNGQLVIGSTGNAPQASTLSAGSGIMITNGPGADTISASGSSGATYELGIFAPPAASSFTFIDSPSSITPTVSNATNAGLVYSVPVTSDGGSFPGAYRPVPTTVPWTLTLRAKYATLIGQYPEFGIWIKDTSGKMIGAVMEGSNGAFSLLAKRCNSNVQYNSNVYGQQVASVPNWFRVTFDGNIIKFFTSWDGQNWLFYYQETKTDFLNGSLQYIGIGGLTGVTNTAYWQPGSTTGALITYWDINDDPASQRASN